MQARYRASKKPLRLGVDLPSSYRISLRDPASPYTQAAGADTIPHPHREAKASGVDSPRLESRSSRDACGCRRHVYVLYLYLSACSSKGHSSGLPLPSRAAVLFYTPLYDQNPIPNYSEFC